MRPSLSTPDLQRFLLSAKRATYATQGNDASVTPLLRDSRQLEYQDGELLYRDMYVGMLRFVGQEIVYVADRAVWSMNYAGGLCADVATPTAGQVYAFLRQALCNAPTELPLRGPHLLTRDAMHYTCQCTGSLDWFYGAETITNGTQCLYQLHFSGGTLA
jgi:hypothetical protein